MQYTYKERTEKKYTVAQALSAAEAILKQKHVKGICMNSVRRYNATDLITLEQLNNISEQIVDDSIFYA